MKLSSPLVSLETNLLSSLMINNENSTLKSIPNNRKRQKSIDKFSSNSKLKNSMKEFKSEEKNHFENSMKIDQSIETDLSEMFSSFESEENLSNENEKLKKQIEDLRRTKLEIQSQNDSQVKTIKRCLVVTYSLLIDRSRMEKKQLRTITMKNRFRLGEFQKQRQGMSIVEKWIDGSEFLEKQKAQQQLNQIKIQFEQNRKLFLKKKFNLSSRKSNQRISSKTKSKSSMPSTIKSIAESSDIEDSTRNSNNNEYSISSTFSNENLNEEEEILHLKKCSLKRQEIELSDQLIELNRQKKIHIDQMKRISNEDQLKYRPSKILRHRYFLSTLIHQNDHCEIYRAFDFREQCHVACKLHFLNDEINSLKIQEHSRQFQLQKLFQDQKILKFIDFFEVNSTICCTVMEYCDGSNLNYFLEQNPTVTEKESRLIILQLMNFLKHFYEQQQSMVIHYDLKAENILLDSGIDCGQIKIVKCFSIKETEELWKHLSLQNANENAHLPPEVFLSDEKLRKVSSKVDVWSLGCLFYQCVYHRKPFDASGYRSMLIKKLENKIQQAQISFPSRPLISDAAKHIIRRCLTDDVNNRPDIFQLMEETYFHMNSSRSISLPTSNLCSRKFSTDFLQILA